MGEAGAEGLVERLKHRLQHSSINDRRYERPMTWDEADALLDALEAQSRELAEALRGEREAILAILTDHMEGSAHLHKLAKAAGDKDGALAHGSAINALVFASAAIRARSVLENSKASLADAHSENPSLSTRGPGEA